MISVVETESFSLIIGIIPISSNVSIVLVGIGACQLVSDTVLCKQYLTATV